MSDQSVCITSEEYDQLVAFQTKLIQREEEHKSEIAKMNDTRERQVGELTAEVQKSYEKVSHLEQQVKNDTNKLANLIEKIKQLEQEGKNNVNKLQKLKEWNAKLGEQVTRMNLKLGQQIKQKQALKQEAESFIKNSESSYANVQKQKDVLQRKIIQMAMQIKNLQDQKHKLSKINSKIQKQHSSSKQIQLMQSKNKILQKQKSEIQTKLKITEIRMQNKQEFVCNYYEMMKQKLSQFDSEQIKELVNNDIDDFIRYLTTKKSFVVKK